MLVNLGRIGTIPISTRALVTALRTCRGSFLTPRASRSDDISADICTQFILVHISLQSSSRLHLCNIIN
jgi:hypothetical protein